MAARVCVVDRAALLEAGGRLGFPRLSIRPAVAVPAGRGAWERFTTNGTEEDLAATRIALAAALAEAAQATASQTPAGGTVARSETTVARFCACGCGREVNGRRRRLHAAERALLAALEGLLAARLAAALLTVRAVAAPEAPR